jgi:hypothetical protein
MHKKTAVDFDEAAATTRGLYELLVSLVGPPRFGERGASFCLGGNGNVLARLELRGGPKMLLDDDTLWVSLEVAEKDLSSALYKKLAKGLRPFSEHGEVHLHVPLGAVPEPKLREIRSLLSECFSATE